jgi:hypothetical protein
MTEADMLAWANLLKTKYGIGWPIDESEEDDAE